MDFRLCPNGANSQYATDLMLRLGPSSLVEFCSTSIVPWIIFMSLTSLVNLWIAIRRTQLHLKFRARADDRARRRHRRFPYMVMVSWITVIATIVFTFTPFVGSNAANGGTALQLELIFLLFGIQSLLLLRKLIRLGKKIIPMSTKFTQNKAYEDKSAQLGRVDNVLTLAFGLGVVILLSQLVLLVALSFAVPTEVPQWISISFGLYAGFLTVFCLSICYQLHRCIRAVRLSYESSGLLTHAHSLSLRRTVHKMETQRRTLIGLAVPMVLFYSLCAAEVVPRHYAVVLVIVTTACLTNVLILSAQVAKPKQARTMDATSSGGNSSAPKASNCADQQGLPAANTLVMKPDADEEEVIQADDVE